MADLEKRLDDAENDLKNSDLDKRLQALQQQREQQQQWLRNYESLIEQLKKDVANVNEIRHAIPTKCYRRVRLEP